MTGSRTTSKDRPTLDRGFLVRGRVQGVGYRWWTRSVAKELGVVGSVRNQPDGSVLVHARGDDSLLGRLQERLREGPPMSKVEAVEIVACELPAGCAAFTIEH